MFFWASLNFHIYSKGIGTRDAVLYVAWAQQFEQQGLLQQADTVYQRAMENQAKPTDTVLQQYR
uniref:BUB1 N-terminal domain-containing protein n=1 Tax=Salmo trutta TaxID=8032 RepID=A0A674E404_SALTR